MEAVLASGKIPKAARFCVWKVGYLKTGHFPCVWNPDKSGFQTLTYYSTIFSVFEVLQAKNAW